MVENGSNIREILQARVDEHGFLSWLGVRIAVVDSGHLVLEVPYRDEITNPPSLGATDGGTIHGGVAATLIDTTGGLCVQSDLPDPVRDVVATIDLNLSYLRPATDDLIATAELIRRGDTIGVADVTVESKTDSGEHAVVAVGRGSYRVYPGDGSGE